MNINGTQYQVIRFDTGSAPAESWFDGQKNTTNFNHAEKKLQSYVIDTYSNQRANITLAVENTDLGNPGMCYGCTKTTPAFANLLPNANITVYHSAFGSRGD